MGETSRSCRVCGALVAPGLTALHSAWHETQEGRGRQFWEEGPGPCLDQMASVVAALKALPPVRARSEFVADLRTRLLAEARSESIEGPDGRIHATAGVCGREQPPSE